MNANVRIMTIRLIEKINNYPKLAADIKIKAKTKVKK